jgi:hypothetical protein
MAGTTRNWTIGAYEDENGGVHVDQDQLLEILSDVAGTLRAVGGMLAVAAERVEVAPGEGQTVGYTVRWQAFSPMRKQEATEDREDPMPHEEPVMPEPEPVEA